MTVSVGANPQLAEAEAYFRKRGTTFAAAMERARVKGGGYEVPRAEVGGQAWEDRARGLESFFYFAGELIGLNQARLAREGSLKVDLDVSLHGAICEFLQGVERARETVSSLLIPREHLKTSLCIAYVLWRLVRQADIHILYAHGNAVFAERVMREIKWHLEGNERFRSAFPDVVWENGRKQSDVWLAYELNVRGHDGTKVPSLCVSSLASAQAGFHYHLVLVDDVVNETNYKSAEERQKGKDFFQHIDHTLQPGGKIVDVGTRWHWDDAHGWLLDPEGVYAGQTRSFVRGVYGEPGELDGEPIFRALWPKERLLDKQRRCTQWEWSYQYLNHPTPEGMAVFRREDLRWFDLEKDGTLGVSPVLFFTAVDPNRSEKTQHDPAVVMTVGRDADGHLWVVDIDRGHPSGPLLVDWIRRQVEQWKSAMVMVEVNSYQLQLCQWLREDMLKHGTAYNIKEMHRGPTTRKYDRISALDPLVRAGGLHIRHGYDVLSMEMEQFPSSKHDDCLDALSDVWAAGWNPQRDEEKRKTPKTGWLMGEILDAIKGRRYTMHRAWRRRA